ncbi:MAG TPA: SDR family oxidoreductase [Candidatus Caenarcaniphilales bacterium]
MAKLIVITGVSRGLGLAMTEQFIHKGHRVLGCARSPEIIETLRQAFGSFHDFAFVDVAEEQQVKAWAERLMADYGPPDLVINNAAVVNQPTPLWQVSPEAFSHLIDVNVKGVFHLIRHFVPAMVARKSGIIVNFSSGWGRYTSPEFGPYCASKWAIEGLTQSLAQELPPGMVAVALNPGIIHTDMLDLAFGQAATAYPSPQDWVLKAVPFLLQLQPKDNGKPLTVPA